MFSSKYILKKHSCLKQKKAVACMAPQNRFACVGQNHLGENWTVLDGDVLSGVHCNILDFVVPLNTSVTVQAWNGSEGSGKFEVFAKVKNCNFMALLRFDKKLCL